MQKFGLQRSRAGRHTALELEIAKEQASSLGRAGKKLRLSLEKYQATLNQDVSLRQRNDQLTQIAENVWALVLQREFIGFIEGNLEWIRENYVIPKEVFNMLGKQK